MVINLFGRGMDIERVNIVFNYDMLEDFDIYLYRVSNRVFVYKNCVWFFIVVVLGIYVDKWVGLSVYGFLFVFRWFV